MPQRPRPRQSHRLRRQTPPVRAPLAPPHSGQPGQSGPQTLDNPAQKAFHNPQQPNPYRPPPPRQTHSKKRTMNDNTTTRADDLTDERYWSKRWNKKRTFRSRRQPPIVLKDILSNVGKGGSPPTVCEIGCAPGSMLLQMAHLQPEYRFYGVDYSETGIETTHDILTNAGVHATLVCEDYFRHMPSEPFDMVVSFGVIEHTSNPILALRRHADYARDGGLVAVCIPNYGTPVVKRMAARVDPTVFDSHNVGIMHPKALEYAMLSAGLSDIAVFQTGKAKLRTTCPTKTISRMCWRTLAKSWNLFSRILPPGIPWSTTLWATGRKTTVQSPSACPKGRADASSGSAEA